MEVDNNDNMLIYQSAAGNIIYQSADGKIKIDVQLRNETV